MFYYFSFVRILEYMERTNMGRVMGVDFGTKRIGIALADENGAMAFPVMVVKNDKLLIPTLSSFIKDKGVNLVVIGESKDFKMKDNPIMEAIRAFAKTLENEVGVEIDYEPEFLTSHQAHHIQGKTDMLDASAAAIILQSYLERNNNK